jgi:hypothetical protein
MLLTKIDRTERRALVMSQRDRQRQTQDGEEHDTHREEPHQQLIRPEPLMKGDTNDATGPESPNGIQKRIRGVPGRLPRCSLCLPSVLGSRARANRERDQTSTTRDPLKIPALSHA